MKWERFRQELARHKMSQSEWARIVGIGRIRVTRWHHAARGVPEWVRSWFQIFSRVPAEDRESIRELLGQPSGKKSSRAARDGRRGQAKRAARYPDQPPEETERPVIS